MGIYCHYMIGKFKPDDTEFEKLKTLFNSMIDKFDFKM